jgi:hypothetical protein
MSAEIQRELKAAQEGRANAGDATRGRGDAGGPNIAPSMRLADRDMHATIAYVDESRFDGANLRIAPAHVSYLLKGRVPELPGWLIEGIERTWRHADLIEDPITLEPMIWLNLSESDALASDPTRPRTLLPAAELFATEAQRTVESRHPRHVQARAATQELFIRWAVTTSRATRTALWKFAAQAAEGAATEEMFEACFGFDYAELRDRLSDYLATAIDDFEWIDPGTLPRLPEIEVRRATSNEIARIRGEWERLAIGYVQRRLPAAREPYLAQARRTLRRAYLAGDRDPRLLATMGLCEIDASNDAGAREFLEPAVAGGVVRPRAYHELARLRFSELRRDAPESKLFSFTELAPVMQPLQRALALSPPLPEVCELLAEAWARCEIAPHDAEFAELQRGPRLYARRPTVGYPTALALARHGKKPEAAAVLEACIDFPADEKLQANMRRLRAELAASR